MTDLEFYKEQGYLVKEQVLSSEEIEGLIAETIKIFRGKRGEVEGLRDTSEMSDDEIFRMHNAIYHSHKISDLFLSTISHPAITEILAEIISPNVKCMQSMIFCKPPGTPGQAWHQDEVPIPTRDKSLCGCWIALDDATLENGCLWVIPGSNKPGLLYERKKQNDPRYDGVDQSYGHPYTDDDAIPVEVKAGSVVFFNGYLMHRSLKNETDDLFRRALVFHYMSAESWLPSGNIPDNRDIVMACGVDPYADKGIASYTKPAIRWVSKEEKAEADDS
ncbi:MAG: phytanoyl-CoA dioxygenase family protein [Lentisphaeria bacterium]|nr:phytanoyl-CoA dioxygenase family protein [Lentisphaeria bacterium]NQZ69131.1 phytanoyl-CoA dioxygenase family protein [Lentisphaeria bacterium]